jgi:DNA-binding FrmR family transcriptional regulator
MSELLEKNDIVRKAHHPEQTKVKLVNRLRRIEGQIRGISRMVESDVYCDDIMSQITSVEAALGGVRKGLLEAHIRGGGVDQIEEGRYQVIDELMQTIGRMTR